MTARLRARLVRSERGAATAFVVGMTIVLLACAGLVVDGGNALNGRMKLADEVEQAARAGASMLDLDALRAPGGGVVRIDQGRARERIYSFLSGSGYTVTEVRFDDDDSVTVTATDVVETQLLSLVGVPPFDIKATATADAVTQ